MCNTKRSPVRIRHCPSTVVHQCDESRRADAEHTDTTPARLVTSVCTGSLVLHGAGLVQGLRVTTHWAFADILEARGGVTVVRDARWVKDGRVVTSAGVSAGIDMSLWIVGQLFDPATARRVQRAIEYDPAPPYTAEV